MYLTALNPILESLAVSVAFGIIAYTAGTVSKSGFLGGVLLGTAIYYCAGWGGFAVLGVFFIAGSALTRIGYRNKAKKGLAQADRGRRGARHALANCAAGLALAVVYKLTSGNQIIGAAFVASFATAAADTAGTEFGSLFGRTAVLPTTFRRVAPGTPGAVSLEGTAASALAALLLASSGWLTSLAANVNLALAAAAAAFLAAWLESVLGAFPGVERLLGNVGKNVLNTVTGALICLILAGLLGLR
ncbi:MAG: DUF92 domain-containing protein [Gemmatimonadota bacterium]|nr:DUF92 domain-containing protein [Gemmatimonadota bacterium]